MLPGKSFYVCLNSLKILGAFSFPFSSELFSFSKNLKGPTPPRP